MRVLYLPAVALAALISVSTSAAPVTYEFTSTWTGGMITSLPYWYEPAFPGGTTFSGSFTLETETPAFYQDLNVSAYRNMLTAATVSIGAEGEYGTFSFGGAFPFPADYNSSLVLVDNPIEFDGGPPHDQLGLSASLAPAPGDSANTFRWFELIGGSSDDGLFPQTPSLEQPFGLAGTPDYPMEFRFQIWMTGEEEHDIALLTQITDLHVVTASGPEPETLTLIGTGLFGVLALRRRRAAPKA